MRRMGTHRVGRQPKSRVFQDKGKLPDLVCDFPTRSLDAVQRNPGTHDIKQMRFTFETETEQRSVPDKGQGFGNFISKSSEA